MCAQLLAAIIAASVENEGSRGWTSFTLLIIELNLIVWVSGRAGGRAKGALLLPLPQPLSLPPPLLPLLPLHPAMHPACGRSPHLPNSRPPDGQPVKLVLPAQVGYYTDRNAGNAVRELEALAAPTALCRRDGAWADLPVRELVPGDLIQLKGGDIIPADCTVGWGRAVQDRGAGQARPAWPPGACSRGAAGLRSAAAGG